MSGIRMSTAIGAISGTSMDGIDVALVRTDGMARVEPGPGMTVPWEPGLKARLLGLLADPSVAERDPLAEMEGLVTAAFAQAVAALMAQEGLRRGDVDLVGLHGQTVYHRPERRFTRQLGDGGQAAVLLGIDTVSAFRLDDVAAGGQGAPFAPLYHAALAETLEKPLVVLNWGGVGNVTWLDGARVLAFDTGPASAMIDDLVRRRLGIPFDEGGLVAASGTVDAAMVEAWMTHPFFDLPAPKSLDRQDFHERTRVVERLGTEDAAATLAAFTTLATAAALRQMPSAPKRWLVTGGGRHNATLMAGLERLVGVKVEPVEAVGWQGDLIEAQCFGYLAVRSARGLPLSLPSTTGVPAPMPGGRLFRARGARVA